MKSSLYFGIKLEKRALLHKLNKLHRQITKNHKKIKTNIEQSKNLTKQNKEKILSQIFKTEILNIQKISPRQRRQKLDRPQMHGYCSVDQVLSHRD